LAEAGTSIRQILLAGLLVAVSVSASAGPCPYVPWDEYKGVKLSRFDQGPSYIFAVTKVKVDADGAPNAYHPDDVGLHCTKGAGFKGLDCPANAGYPHSTWWRSILVPDPTNPARAFVQPAGSEFAGFFVSQTSLTDPAKAATDPKKYVDARTVPYVVSPREFHQKKGTGAIGDLGYAVNRTNGKRSPFVVAEIGPSTAALGEMSMALAEAMGGTNPNPRTGAGAPTGKIVFVIFPNSGKAHRWPLTNEQMTTRAGELLAKSGGPEGVLACGD
jgi:hypothetical protein